MTIPYAEPQVTVLISSPPLRGKKSLLQSERMAKLLIDVLFHYQKQSKYRLQPVRRGLVPAPEEFPYSSAILMLDEVPQWLKPAA